MIRFRRKPESVGLRHVVDGMVLFFVLVYGECGDYCGIICHMVVVLLLCNMCYLEFDVCPQLCWFIAVSLCMLRLCIICLLSC